MGFLAHLWLGLTVAYALPVPVNKHQPVGGRLVRFLYVLKTVENDGGYDLISAAHDAMPIDYYYYYSFILRYNMRPGVASRPV